MKTKTTAKAKKQNLVQTTASKLAKRKGTSSKALRAFAGKAAAAKATAEKPELVELDGNMLAEVVAAAKAVRDHAYAPYSKYHVGAALLTKSGEIFLGCNVENASYGATICAERNAVFQMVAAGQRDPVLAVVVTEGPEPAAPCGMCRQVMAEFAPKLPVVLVASPRGAKGEDVLRVTSLEELLPDAFGPAALEAKTATRRRAG